MKARTYCLCNLPRWNVRRASAPDGYREGDTTRKVAVEPRPVKRRYKGSSRDEAKVSRPVPRGGGGGNTASLPDNGQPNSSPGWMKCPILEAGCGPTPYAQGSVPVRLTERESTPERAQRVLNANSSAITTCAPRNAKARATCRPMPRPAPVTTTTRF